MAVGLGCSFVTQRCSNANVFPYLCEDNTDETMCTYDHLSKVCHHTKALKFNASYYAHIGYLF